MTIKQSLIIAGSIIIAGLVHAYAVSIGPAAINGCIFNATPPTALTDGSQVPFSCDATGKLRVTTTF